MRTYLFLCLVSLTFLFSCKKKNPDPIPVVNYLQINMLPFYSNNGNTELILDSLYTTPEGYRVKFTDIKCYFTLLRNGSSELTQAAYFDFREKGKQLLHMEGDYLKFPSLQGIIGVDTSLNHDDPSTFSNDSPLNISNAGTMHWGWNPGYIFISIEGKADTLINGIDNLDLSFSYHIGTDSYLNAFSFSSLNWTDIGNNTHLSQWKLNMYNFLHGSNPVDLKTEYLTHSGAGQQNLTQKITNNFSQSIIPF